MKAAHIGTSGWQYKHWRESFYQGLPQRTWLTCAASAFTGLEVDGTFYRLQEKATYESWRDQTPDGFRFAIRGHRYITHNKKLLDVDEAILKTKEPATGLGRKLAVVLWQLPPFLRSDVPRLRRFAQSLHNHWPETRHAMEFRNESWFTDEVADVLAECGIANTISDSGSWPRWDAVTTNLVYVRLHGKPCTYASGYESAVPEWADRVGTWLHQGREVHVYFDNDSQGKAPSDALLLIEAVSKFNSVQA